MEVNRVFHLERYLKTFKKHFECDIESFDDSCMFLTKYEWSFHDGPKTEVRSAFFHGEVAIAYFQHVWVVPSPGSRVLPPLVVLLSDTHDRIPGI